MRVVDGGEDVITSGGRFGAVCRLVDQGSLLSPGSGSGCRFCVECLLKYF